MTINCKKCGTLIDVTSNDNVIKLNKVSVIICWNCKHKHFII